MTSLNFLHIALGAGFLILVLFVCILLVYLIRIVKDMSEVTGKIKVTAEKINDLVLQPFSIITEVYERIKPYLAKFHGKKEEENEEKYDDEIQKEK